MYPGMMPQQTNSPFIDATANYSSMFPMNPPSAQMPFGNSPMGMLANVGMNSAFSQFGMTASQFMPMQSMYDQMSSRYYEMQTQQMLATASQQDINTQVRLAQSISTRMGFGWGADQEATARQIAKDFSGVAPLFAQMAPSTYDALHGSRGSAVVMASSLARTAPFMIDPVTGATGLSSASADAYFSAVDRGLYGSPDAMRAMYGMGMGEFGMSFQQVASRGLLGRSIGTYSRGEQQELLARNMLNSGGAASMEEALAGISSLTSDEFDAKLRSFDASRVTERMKSLAGAVAAMKDIFGSLGNPDAPMAQIISGLDAMTQGGLSSLSGAQVEKIVRNTKALSDRTGMSIEAITAMTSQAASITDAYGLDRTLAVQAGLHSAAYGSAYANMGMGGNFGSMGRDQATMMDARLSAQALGSEVVNKAGAFMRTVEAFNPAAGSTAAKLAEAIRNGATTFEGQRMTDVMTNENLGRILSGSGLSAAAQQSFVNSLNDPFGNQKYISDNDLGNFGRAQQTSEVMRMIGNPAAGQGISNALRSSGVAADKAASVANALSGKLAEEFMNSELDPNDAKNRFAMASKIEADLKAQGITPTRDMIQLIGENVYSRWNNLSKYRGGQGDLVKDRQMYSTRVIDEAALVQANAAADADFAKRLNTLGRTGPLRRTIDTLMKDGDMSVTDAIGEVLGGIPRDKITTELESQVGELATLSRGLASMRGEGPRGAFSERQLKERAAMLQRFDALMGGADDVKGLRDTLQDLGMDVGRQVTAGDFGAIAATKKALLRDIAGGNTAQVSRGSKSYIARVGNVFSAILGDKATLAKLDSSEAINKLGYNKMILEEKAKSAGGLDKILNDKDHPDHAFVLSLMGEIDEGLAAIDADVNNDTGGHFKDGDLSSTDFGADFNRSAEEYTTDIFKRLEKAGVEGLDKDKINSLLSGDRNLASLVNAYTDHHLNYVENAETVTKLKGDEAVRKFNSMGLAGELTGSDLREYNIFGDFSRAVGAYEDLSQISGGDFTNWVEKLKKGGGGSAAERASAPTKMTITGTIDLTNGSFEGHGTDFQ